MPRTKSARKVGWREVLKTKEFGRIYCYFRDGAELKARVEQVAAPRDEGGRKTVTVTHSNPQRKRPGQDAWEQSRVHGLDLYLGVVPDEVTRHPGGCFSFPAPCRGMLVILQPANRQVPSKDTVKRAHGMA